MKQTIKNGKYDYKTSQTEKLEIIGFHQTIATITPSEALQMAQALISASQNPESDGSVSINFDMHYPEYNGSAPTITMSFTGQGYWQPELHWATVEGHEIYSLNDEWLEADIKAGA